MSMLNFTRPFVLICSCYKTRLGLATTETAACFLRWIVGGFLKIRLLKVVAQYSSINLLFSDFLIIAYSTARRPVMVRRIKTDHVSK